MAKNELVRAPYNFVPFSNKILTPYPDESAVPPHDAILPEGLTGEIRVTVTAKTPVFVSDGREHFHRTQAREFAIPGSTFKGLLRETMQILGFGLLRPGEDLEDYQIYFREISSARDAVGNNVKQHYRAALDVQTRRSPESGKSYSVPANVRSGWLYREGGAYRIYPTREPYLRVSRKSEDVQPLGGGDARTVPVGYLAGDGRVKKLVPADQAGPGMRRGALLYTGRPVGKVKNHLYLFPEPDRDAEPLAVPDRDLLSFREDYEGRKNALKGLRDRGDPRSEAEWLSFWQLPAEGQGKPVFYVHHDGHLYFGMSQFLRIGYPHSMAEGLPKHHLDLLAGERVPLDYPHAVFGFAEKDSAYRSRVSVGDLTAAPGTREGAPVKMILGNPKPSYYPGYVREGKDYTEEDFQLRGYKQYWLKDVQTAAADPGKERVASTLRPLPAGTVFRGTLRFQNLTAEELGLLLWCLRLEPGCCHTLGMGKPYGYGRAELTVDALRLLDHGRLYGPDLAADPWTDATARVGDYISRYDRLAAEALYWKKPKKRPSVAVMPEIQDFFFMKRSLRPAEEAGYMVLSEYQNVRNPLPTAEDFRTREEEQPSAPPPAQETDLFAALRNKKWSL